jgi:hypothetical protein
MLNIVKKKVNSMDQMVVFICVSSTDYSVHISYSFPLFYYFYFLFFYSLEKITCSSVFGFKISISSIPEM